MVEKLFRGHPPGENPCTAIPSLSVLSAKSVVPNTFLGGGAVDGAWIGYRPVNSQARSDLARYLQSDLRPTHNCRLTTNLRRLPSTIRLLMDDSCSLLQWIIWFNFRKGKRKSSEKCCHSRVGASS